jgi:hypothetical protein
MDRKFDRLPQFDNRSRRFGISDVVTAVEPKKKYWTPGVVMDQGREGACVGFGWTTELVASPKPFTISAEYGNEYALGVYHRAQELDEWEGTSYDGTSVLAGAKVMQERGYIPEYRWAFGVEQVRDAVISEGPVVLGINWLEGMYETRPSGLVEVNGSVVGGHCITLTGYNPRARLKGEKGYFEGFRWKNSWGLSYGVNGLGFIKIEDLDTLLKADGEACVPMQRQKVRF